MIPMPPHLRALAFCLSMFAAGCLFFPEPENPSKQGGGSDTETLTGTVAFRSGLPAAGALVKLLPAAYDPSRPDTALIRRTLTDDSGHFRFEKVDGAVIYNVIAGKPAEAAWAFARGVKAGKERKTLSLDPAKVFLFSLHSAVYAQVDSGVAYFPGTDILARCDGIVASKVDSVPAGVLRLVVESRAGWKHDTTLVSVGDTAEVRADRNGIALSP